MSDEKPEGNPKEQKRSSAQVQQDYAKLCAQAGEKQFSKAVIDAELQQMNQQLLNLRNEYSEAQKAEEEASKKKSSEPNSSEPNSTTEAASTSSADSTSANAPVTSESAQDESNAEPSQPVSS